MHWKRRIGSRIAGAISLALATTVLMVPAQAATADRYHVELAAWIPMDRVSGPQPPLGGSLGPFCIGTAAALANYNGNNHAGYDGSYKALVSYDFTYDGSKFANLSAPHVDYGPTYADTIGGCHYEAHATSDGGVRTTANGVQLWMSTANPLLPLHLAPAIDARLDISFKSRDQMTAVHQYDHFPSHGFRVVKNGLTIATAIDFDASCVTATGPVGAANLFKGLSTWGNPRTHNIDLRVPGQTYLGPCGKTAPTPLSYPAPGAPVATPTPGNQSPVPAFTYTRLAGPGNQVGLDASASRDPDGSISYYKWTSNGTQLGLGRNVITKLGTAASAPVTLTVTDNRGKAVAVTKTILLANRAPVIAGVTPDDNVTYFGIQPTLSAMARDNDGDTLSYHYRLSGNGVDLSSPWVAGSWQLPAHSIDPGLAYTWTVDVRDGRGGTASRTSTIRIANLPTSKRLVSLSNGLGYWQVASDGGVFTYGSAQFYGSVPGLGITLNNIIGMARTPDDKGYWLVGSDGGVFSFGDAQFYGSLPGLGKHVNNIVGMAPTQTGRGYWLVGSDGGVFTFGDAPFYGSKGGQPLNAPVVSMAPTSSGGGYWLGAADGGVFTFGDAPFYGSKGGQPLNAPVVDLQVTPSGQGYWLAAADGGVFTFGDAQFFGSTGGQPLNGRVTSLSPTANGYGYWLNACDGGVFAFGNAQFMGSNPVYGCRGT